MLVRPGSMNLLRNKCVVMFSGALCCIREKTMRRLVWNLFKLAMALAIVIPVTIIVLATAMGLFVAMLGLAILALRIAFVALVAWGLFRLGKGLFGASPERSQAEEARQLRSFDPYYEAAQRELDRELGIR